MYVDAATWCAKHSWNQACCRCVISKESSGNAHACHRNSNGSIDAGLWQINQMNWASCSGGSAPCDPSTNLNCAIKVYNWGGRTWRLWSTCGSPSILCVNREPSLRRGWQVVNLFHSIQFSSCF